MIQHLTPEENEALREFSRINDDSQRIPSIVVKREDGQHHWAYLSDDLERRRRLYLTNDPDPQAKETTNGHRREIPGD